MDDSRHLSDGDIHTNELNYRMSCLLRSFQFLFFIILIEKGITARTKITACKGARLEIFYTLSKLCLWRGRNKPKHLGVSCLKNKQKKMPSLSLRNTNNSMIADFAISTCPRTLGADGVVVSDNIFSGRCVECLFTSASTKCNNKKCTNNNYST